MTVLYNYTQPSAILQGNKNYTKSQKGPKSMWIADQWKEYEVLDCSSGERLERWDKYLLVRPDPQVICNTPKKHPGWESRNATTTAARRAAGNGNSLTCPSSGTSIMAPSRSS